MKNVNEKLQKKLSPAHVWALAFGCIVGSGAFLLPGDSFLPQAGILGTAIAFVIAALLMIVVSINYHYMINKYPVAGGEFSYATNTFGRTNGFICAWFLGLSYLTIVPLNATGLAVVGRNIFDDIFQVGFHYQIAGFDVYFGELLLALFAVVLFAILGMFGVKTTGVFQLILVVSLVGGVLIVALGTLLRGNVSVETLSPAYYPSGNVIGGLLAVIAVAPFCFVGFDTIPQAAEEFNFDVKKSKVIMFFAIVFGASIYVILNTIAAVNFPVGYGSWVEYIDDLKNIEGIGSLPTFHAAYNVFGKFGLFFIGIAVLGAILSGIMGFYMATSRLLYSMSRDGMLPAWFGKLNKKYKTPINALLFVMLISLIAPFWGRTVLGWIVDMSSVGAAVGYGYTSLAALLYAKKEKNTKIILSGIAGTIIALLILVLLLVPIKGLSCSLGKESYICLGAWSILGFIFYCVTKRKNKS